MVRTNAVCELVQDGDTFRTNTQAWIRLARVNAPELGTPAGTGAKLVLSSLISDKTISYESLATDAFGRVVAEVWVSGTNVNDYMRAHGYA